MYDSAQTEPASGTSKELVPEAGQDRCILRKEKRFPHSVSFSLTYDGNPISPAALPLQKDILFRTNLRWLLGLHKQRLVHGHPERTRMIEFIKKGELTWYSDLKALSDDSLEPHAAFATDSEEKALLSCTRYLLFHSAIEKWPWLFLGDLQKLVWHFSATDVFPRSFLELYREPWSCPYGQYSPAYTRILMRNSRVAKF